jgi:hypothetical protein
MQHFVEPKHGNLPCVDGADFLRYFKQFLDDWVLKTAAPLVSQAAGSLPTSSVV